jgi:heterotetrameric sarcosine oxidase gamma subunit
MNGTDCNGVRLTRCIADVVQVSAPRGCSAKVIGSAHATGLIWPDVGHASRSPESIAISVSPDRWLLITAPAPPDASAHHWRRAFAPHGVVVDVSSAWTLIRLRGSSVRSVLARGCRLNLEATSFPEGKAAGTYFANVALILAWFETGPLLMTPSTTAQHFCECLTRAGQAYGLGADQVGVPWSEGDLPFDAVP